MFVEAECFKCFSVVEFFQTNHVRTKWLLE